MYSEFVCGFRFGNKILFYTIIEFYVFNFMISRMTSIPSCDRLVYTRKNITLIIRAVIISGNIVFFFSNKFCYYVTLFS